MIRFLRVPFRHQKGMTVLEVVISLFIGALALLVLQFMYKALFTASTNIRDITDIQRQLRISAAHIKKEISNIGAGIGSSSSIAGFDSSKITFSYMDLLGRHCPNDSEVVTIAYETKSDTLLEKVTCNGSLISNNAILIAPESILLNFKYLDKGGNNTGTSDSVKMIEYSLELGSKNPMNNVENKRRTISKVQLKNHL